MFYAVLALLTLIGKGSSKHAGVLALFDQHFIKTGHFPPEMSRLLHKAFDLRQMGDYRELMVLTEEDVCEVLQAAQEFLQQVESYLATQLA